MSNRAQKADCTPIGNPGTVSAIMAEIRSSGPITFERFMELALYHPDFGYYTRTTDANGEERAGHDRIGPNRIGQNRIGWSGDYYTSFDAHPLLARALAKQIAQLDEQLGRPNPLTLVEMGPGKGLLARDFLTACDTDNPSPLRPDRTQPGHGRGAAGASGSLARHAPHFLAERAGRSA
jgi:hypothetical protein